MAKKDIIEEEVVIPQLVADWIKYCKNTSLSLARALAVSEEDFYNYANQKDYLDLLYYLGSSVNQEKFAKAWVYGYEIEKEKRYLVKMVGLSNNLSYLNYDSIDDEWYFNDADNGYAVGTHHTKKQLEDAGFSEVFNNPLFKVEEVEEG